MSKQEFYYRFEAIALDLSDEQEIRTDNLKLTHFSCLDEQFAKLKAAYDNMLRERADIMVNPLPEVCGLAELSVYHNIKFKLFSRKVKSQQFTLCATTYDSDGAMSLYFYDTNDFYFVKQAFEKLITECKIPDFSLWEHIFIG